MISGYSIQHWPQHSFRLQIWSLATNMSPAAAHNTYFIMTLGTSTDNELHNMLFWLSSHIHHSLFKDTDCGSQHGYQWQHRWVISINFPWQLRMTDIINLFQIVLNQYHEVLEEIAHWLVACGSRNLKYTMVSVARDTKRVSESRYNLVKKLL